MKTLKELQEEKANLVNRAEALVQIAEEEKRELTADEKTEIDTILGVENKGGKIELIQSDIGRLEKLEKRQAELAQKQGAKAFDDADKSKGRIEAVPYNGPLNGYANSEHAFIAGKWAAANILGDANASQWCKDRGLMNVMTEGSNTKGGALVIPQIESAVISLFETYSAFYSNAEVVSMNSSEYRFVSETDELTAYPVGETTSGSDANASDLGFRMHTLNAKPWQVMSHVSMDLNADATFNVANAVSTAMARAYSKAIDRSGFLGDATSTYHGIVGLNNALAAGSIHTAAAGNTSFATLDDQDFLDMVGKLPDYAKPGAKWYISREGYYASMARLLRAANGNTVADLGNGPVLQYAGIPVVLTRSTNTTLSVQTSTNGLCYLGDIRQAVKIGVRQGMEMMVYRELYARQRQIGLESTMRFDIAVHQTGTASAAGSILSLQTPAS